MPIRQLPSDKGALGLVLVFLSVWGVLSLLYSVLAYGAITWSPSFYIKYADYSQRREPKASQTKVSGIQIPQSAQIMVEQGKRLYNELGCTLCHGPGGKGGVRNKNYVNDTIPALNTLAEKLLLYEPEDVEAFLQALVEGKVDAQSLDVPNAPSVIAKYEIVRDTILHGRQSGKKDPKDVQPINMPAFKGKLTEQDIDSIVAYLLTLYPWEEDSTQ